MTLFEVEELTSYWAQHPPLHLLLAAYLGVGNHKRRSTPPKATGRGKRSGSDVSSMLAQLGHGFSAGDVHAGLSPVILDFAELRRAAMLPD
jgi:hypothetical protein